MTGKTVHVVGTGTIGEPLIGLLCNYREALGVGQVTFNKRSPVLTDRPKVRELLRKGAHLAVEDDVREGFLQLGLEPSFSHEEALDRADVVIDCTPSGIGLKNKEELYMPRRASGRGFLAQGSEFGFGKMYARGINDQALVPGEDQFLQIVSCNTHNLAVLIQTLAIGSGKGLEEGRFVCMRRANDISQTTEFTPSPEVGKHGDSQFGTHHARDAYHLFRTMSNELNLFSSAIKLNTQYMHAVHFSLKLKEKITKDEVIDLCRSNDHIALTHKKSANLVFSFGRDQGHYGRILNVAVVVVPSLTIRNEREVVGFCFTPQDGNSLLSSVSATAWFIDPARYVERIQVLKPFFFEEV
jgi:glyceraldehyde-3-phosphate dehydrogenase (NAD(P))